MGPCVGVVVPLYNARGALARTLASLSAQTIVDWSCVVVDDGSTDGSGDEARRLVATDAHSRFTVLAQANGGVSRARNAGLDLLLGRAEPPEYVLMLDAGDTLAPAALESLVAAARAAGTPGALGDFRFVSPAGRPVGTHTGRYQRVGLDELLGSVYMLTHAHLIRSTLYRGVRFDPSLEVVEDTDVWLRLAEAGAIWARCESIVADYWVGQRSRSTDQARMQAWTERVYAGAYSRCAGRPSVDAAPARLEGLLARSAFQHATRAAIAEGDAGLAGAEAIFAPYAGLLEPDATLIARSARRAVMLTLALNPDDTADRSLWLAASVRWVQRLATLGWARPGEVQTAVDALPAAPSAPTPSAPATQGASR